MYSCSVNVQYTCLSHSSFFTLTKTRVHLVETSEDSNYNINCISQVDSQVGIVNLVFKTLSLVNTL